MSFIGLTFLSWEVQIKLFVSVSVICMFLHLNLILVSWLVDRNKCCHSYGYCFLSHIVQEHNTSETNFINGIHLSVCVMLYADDSQLYLSFLLYVSTISARISACLTSILTWMKEHHVQHNLLKTEPLVVAESTTVRHQTSPARILATPPSKVCKKTSYLLMITLHPSLICWFILHNIRKIRPWQDEYAAQLLHRSLFKWYRTQQNVWSSTRQKRGTCHTASRLSVLASNNWSNQAEALDICLQSINQTTTHLPQSPQFRSMLPLGHYTLC